MAVATDKSIERSSVIISVFSTTPGIGKTIVAINLATGLAHEGYKVCLCDLDLQFGDVMNYLQLTSTKTVAGAQREMLDYPKTFNIRNFLTEYRQGNVTFSILPAPLYVFDAYQTDVQIVTNIIGQLNYFDYVILDLNSMFSALNLAMLDLSTVINYVGVIDFLPALKNYKVGYDTLESRDVERLLGESFYHRLPNDYPSVNKSINTGQPLMFAAPDSKLTKSFDDLVGLYTNRPKSMLQPEEQSTSGGGGFFNKVKGWFGF